MLLIIKNYLIKNKIPLAEIFVLKKLEEEPSNIKFLSFLKK